MDKIPFNPYIVGNPIKTKEMFFGREDDFHYVIKKLGTGRSNQILIFCGDRRSGKTSILFQILLGRLGPGFLPILIDMQILAGIRNDRDFYMSIIDAACTQLNLPDITLESFQDKNTETTIEGLFQSFLFKIEKKFPDKILLFLLDEYELLETKIKDESLSENIIHFLAGILESPLKISFIFTGSTNLENRKVGYWKTLLGKSIYRKISYLSPNDTGRLITEPLKKYIHYPEEIVASIYRLSGGQPFYTQVMCQNIVDLLIEEERNAPTKGDLKAISKDIVNNPLPQMIYSWNNLKDYVRLVLSALSGVLLSPQGWAGTQEVFKYLRKNKIQLPFKKGQINILLEEAYHQEILRKNDQGLYSFRMDIFRQWIKKEHSIWKVVKEIGIELKKPFNLLLVALLSGISIIAVIIIWSLILSGSNGFKVDGQDNTRDSGVTDIREPEQIKNIEIIANNGPFRVIIDSTTSFTSEGLPDEKKIILPSLTRSEHSFEFVCIQTAERKTETIEITGDTKSIGVVFSEKSAEQTKKPGPGATSTAAVTGSIFISSDPAKARILLDGEETGKTTPAYLKDLKLGEYTLEIILEGYRSEIVTITLDSEETPEKEIILTKAIGFLILKIRPTALVYFNNITKLIKDDDTTYPIETPRVKALNVQTGSHTLTIKNESMDFERIITVTIDENKTTTIDWDIKKDINPTFTEE
ncbi:MAG: PEGA domain-containing protein [Spirochaetales bacterium]|nr:PEGA domain-containing protein [Spirochaetales bacterium]